MTVHVLAAAAVSPFGRGWSGLADAVATRAIARSTTSALAATHPGVAAYAVAADALGDAVPLRARKLMSRGALLAATTMADLVRAVAPRPVADAGCFLGVGASAGVMTELHAMLRASIVDGAWSLARFGGPGLAACNPLLAFQLMNNFTMCHAAIQEGIGGPNGAWFSRGAGTVVALAEALRSVDDGDCAIAIAGGADSALHPVTWSELVRDGRVAAGLVPSEGCGLVALAADGGVARLTRAEVLAPGGADPIAAARDALTAGVDEVVVAAWGDPPRRALAAAIGAAAPCARVLDVGAALGDALAATPALAWLVALDRIAHGARRVLALSIGVDGELGVVELARPP